MKKQPIVYSRSFEYDYKDCHFKVSRENVKYNRYESYTLSYDGECLCKFNYIPKSRVIVFTPDGEYFSQQNVTSLYEATQYVYRLMYKYIKKMLGNDDHEA